MRPQLLALNDLDVFYSRTETKSTHLRWWNAPGLAGWWNVENCVVCFTTKSALVVGQLRLHALHVRGFWDARGRSELVGSPDRPEDLVKYLFRSLRLLILGLPFHRVGDDVRVLKATPPSQRRSADLTGTFRLVRTSSRR